MGHLVKEPIKNEKHVVRKFRFCKRSRAAQVDKEDCDRPLYSLEPSTYPPVRGTRAGGQQRSHAQIRGRADLAGESRFRGRTYAAQRLSLQLLRLMHILATLIHLDPAGSATRTPTAHRRMRDTVLAQRFEHRCSRRNRLCGTMFDWVTRCETPGTDRRIVSQLHRPYIRFPPHYLRGRQLGQSWLAPAVRRIPAPIALHNRSVPCPP